MSKTIIRLEVSFFFLLYITVMMSSDIIKNNTDNATFKTLISISYLLGYRGNTKYHITISSTILNRIMPNIIRILFFLFLFLTILQQTIDYKIDPFSPCIIIFKRYYIFAILFSTFFYHFRYAVRKTLHITIFNFSQPVLRNDF